MRLTSTLPAFLLLLTGCGMLLGLDEYVLSACDDGSRGGDEVDADCGGPTCPACADGRACAAPSDCQSGMCVAKVCVAPSCEDSTKNASESDVDCGGTTCDPCADNRTCAVASDCASGVCAGAVCRAPTCADMVTNGAETDSDCGGSSCSPCALGKTCAAHADCIAEAVCNAGVCALDHLWTKAFGDTTKQEASGVAFDPKTGAVIVGGTINGSVDFGGPMPVMSAGGGDVFFAKLDEKDGSHISSKGFGSSEAQFEARIAVDSDGAVFLGSTGFGVMNFGMGDLSSAGATDVFLAKFSSFGGPLWHARFGDADGQFLSGLTTDIADNLFLVGTFGGTIDFGGQPFTGTNGSDMFLASIKGFDAEHRWSRAFDVSVAITQPAVAVDTAGNVLVAGRYDGTVSFGGEVHSSLAGPDAFIAKLNGAGDYIWSKSWGSTGIQGISSVSADANGDVYVAGSFENAMTLPNGTVVMGKGGTDPFIAKLDGMTGDHLWVKAFGNEGENQEAQAVAVDASGDLIVAGRFDGALEFDQGSYKASGPIDLFVAKVSAMGDLFWFKHGQGAASASVKGLSVAEDGRTAVAGIFAGALSFGGDGVQSQTGPGDAFVALLWPP